MIGLADWKWRTASISKFLRRRYGIIIWFTGTGCRVTGSGLGAAFNMVMYKLPLFFIYSLY